MTVIAGVRAGGAVFMAADSATARGWELTVRQDVKAFRNRSYLIGFTTSWRMGQLLQYAFQPPLPPQNGDLHRFMCTTWIDDVRACLKAGGWAKLDNAQEQGGEFLVGVNGRLFIVHGDYQVAEPAADFAAIGCGADLALGALHATTMWSARRRLGAAMAAAEQFSAGVCGPFTYLRLGKTAGKS